MGAVAPKIIIIKIFNYNLVGTQLQKWDRYTSTTKYGLLN